MVEGAEWGALTPFPIHPPVSPEVSFYKHRRNRDESYRLTVTAQGPEVTSLHSSPLPVLPLEGSTEGRESFAESAGWSATVKIPGGGRREGAPAAAKAAVQALGPDSPRCGHQVARPPTARVCAWLWDLEATPRRSPWKRRARCGRWLLWPSGWA